MIVITSNNPNLKYHDDYDFFREVYYKNEPFTGTIKDANEETDYVGGMANGKNITTYENGQINTTAIYKNGALVHLKSFYKTGQPRRETTIKEGKMWDQNGNLLNEFNENFTKNYFSTGELKSIYDHKNEEWRIKYYSKKGELIATQFSDKYTVNYTRKVVYEYAALLNNYLDLLEQGEEELEYDTGESHRVHIIWMGFWDIFDKDPKQYFEIVNHVIQHKSLKVIEAIARIIAIHKFEPYIEKQNEKNSACYQLIEYFREIQDKSYPDREYKKVNL
jgi:antitoxin component YwqK of YwqJK toxin-antitoxin module